jgi:hypothetical protein
LILKPILFIAGMRHIELNPVRAGMVADPADYPWSSYHSNGLGQAGDVVVAHPEYLRLETSDCIYGNVTLRFYGFVWLVVLPSALQ